MTVINGHDLGEPNTDPLAVLYLIVAAVWTLLIAGGLFALCRARDTVAVRIRGLALTVSTVIVLHLYAIAVLLVYPLNGLFLCSAEFWIMSTLLPFGFALFQASNVKLLSYYEEQRNLAAQSGLGQFRRHVKLNLRGFATYWRQLNTVQKTYFSIICGLIVQLLVTFGLFFGSRMFHKSFGSFGEYVGQKKCRHGVEWIPSVFWQFFWTYGFGPYILFSIRKIHDTHYWALQTRLAIMSCLPGTPMWLAFLYAGNDTVASVNKYFVAAGWFLPGLFTMQVVAIVIPLLDVKQASTLKRRASSIYSNASTKSREIYSMSALENQLETNIEPLMAWSANREFTAENIVFLKAVRDFKKKWIQIEKQGPLLVPQLHSRYEEAGRIFYSLVNPNTARFNINIDFRTYSELEPIFENLTYKAWIGASGECCDNVVAPWNDLDRPSTSDESSTDGKVFVIPMSTSKLELHNSSQSIPETFGINVFDKAAKSVKYLVLTNTWVKFVDSGEVASLSDTDISRTSKV